MKKLLYCLIIASSVNLLASSLLLENFFQISLAYEKANKLFSYILDGTLINDRLQKKYATLKKIDQETAALIKRCKNKKDVDCDTIEIYINNVLKKCDNCLQEYTDNPDFFNSANEDLDGNDFNILCACNAYKICLEEASKYIEKNKASS